MALPGQQLQIFESDQTELNKNSMISSEMPGFEA